MSNDKIDTTPLPGVKADDPDKGAENPELSDEEVAERLNQDPEVDSRDGVIPDGTEDPADPDGHGGVAAVPFDPTRPARPHGI